MLSKNIFGPFLKKNVLFAAFALLKIINKIHLHFETDLYNFELSAFLKMVPIPSRIRVIISVIKTKSKI